MHPASTNTAPEQPIDALKREGEECSSGFCCLICDRSMVKPPCLLGLSAPGSRSSACRFELCEVRERCQGNVVGCSEGRMLLVSFSLLATNVEFRD